MGIFDLNENTNVIKESFMGSDIYYIDDFYKYPNDIIKMLNNSETYMHTPGINPLCKSLNGVYFFDGRNRIRTNMVRHVYDYLSKLCGQKPDYEITRDKVVTNKFKFYKNDFNNYKNNYWFPHTDEGYTGIVYLNKNDDVCGTNLYKQIRPDLPRSRGEHVDPWRSKENWEIIKTFKPKYNRCVLFNGKKFYHGMHIPDDRYFGDEYRLNQVLFFGEKA